MIDITRCGEIAISSEMTQAIVCVISDSDPLEWIRLALMAAGPVILTVGVIIATKSIASAKETARKRATLDMIEKVESMPHYRAMHATFSYHRNKKSFDRLHNPTESKDKSERTDVLDYLNHYELVAIGLKRDTLDEEFYKDWMRGPFVRDWNAAVDFIQRERWKYDETKKEWHYHDALFQNFQTYAARWSADAKRLDRHSSDPPSTPKGPGDEAYPDGKSS